MYYLSQAGMSGRDIIWDQNYRHNLHIRKVLKTIMLDYKGDRTSADFIALETYTKRVWFSNGIHHHYSMTKFKAEFPKEYFEGLCKELNISVNEEALKAIFDQDFDNKKVNLILIKAWLRVLQLISTIRELLSRKLMPIMLKLK